ncbi:MAG TPA: hypothetical protein VGL13_15575, partial [Polyangiaceae bacterium]
RIFLAGAAAMWASRAGRALADDPPLVDGSGQPLPQTQDEPSITSDRFRARIDLLVNAIVRDDPDSAGPVFFPVVAYRQVKAIADPDRDWKMRLWAAFARDIHEYRRRLGKNAHDAHLARIDVPQDRARWMKPGSEGNKLGYFRVLRSQMRFSLPGGREQSLEVTSMISWRGEWYVVHLNGFG